MKRFIGTIIARIGAFLWENGGWNGEEYYEDLTVFGKLGYHVFVGGLCLMGVTEEDLERVSNL